MSIFTRQATSNTTPDPGLGGSAVTGNTNTGHGSTQSQASVSGSPTGASQSKTCLWSGFGNVTWNQARQKRVTIKFNWTLDAAAQVISNGFGTGGSATFNFLVEASVDGGSNWPHFLKSDSGFVLVILGPDNQSDAEDAPSGSVSFNLPNPDTVDITQVRLRDRITADASLTGDGNGSASALSLASVSGIELEIETIDSYGVITIM